MVLERRAPTFLIVTLSAAMRWRDKRFNLMFKKSKPAIVEQHSYTCTQDREYNLHFLVIMYLSPRKGVKDGYKITIYFCWATAMANVLSLNLCGCSIYIYETVMKIMILMLMIIIAMMLAKVVAVLEGWSLKQRCCSWHKRWCMVTVTHFTSFLGFPPLLTKIFRNEAEHDDDDYHESVVTCNKKLHV